jgi:flagellar hook protein FlgE
MMRSLWSGVSGLNAHQVAMDVEGNNIANVNTVGFKYSRTNFQDLLSQTVKASTAPQGNLGGKNSLQVGLGASVSSVETMFKQGSIQNTDKATDMAISGDGFFVVTGDGGKTSKYTRAGDFSFDSNGNFVDPNGYIVQGWIADSDTYNIDSSAGVKPISIPPGLTTPAHATSQVAIKANLNSGDYIDEMSNTDATLLPTDDLNGTYNAIGEKISLTEDVDKFKFILDKADGTQDTITLTYGKSESDTDGKFTTIRELLDEINRIIKDSTGEKNIYVYLNGDGRIVDDNNTITFDTTSNSSKLAEVLKALNGPATTSENIKHIQNAFIGADDVAELFDENGEAINLEDGQGITASIESLGETRKFIYSSDPITSSEGCGGSNGTYQASDPIVSDSSEGMHWTYDSNNERAYFNVNQRVTFRFSDGTDHTYVYGDDFQTIEELCCLVNKDLSDANINDTLTFSNGKIVESDGNGVTDVSVQDSSGNNVNDTTSGLGRMGRILDGLDGTNSQTHEFRKNDIYYFHDIADLENLWQMAINDSGDSLNSTSGNSGVVSIQDGKISIKNNSSNSFNITIGGYPDSEHDNDKFSGIFSAVNGTISAGGTALSQAMKAATHTTSIDIFDSLGSKHTLTIHYRKTHTSTAANDPTVWKFYAEVPTPSSLDNPANGYVKFNPDGSLNSFNPPSIIFNANNGSDIGQAIQFDFGNLNGFSGLTSFDAPSSTSGQTQDGYPGGDLQDLVVDQSGTIIGVFTNGRSYSLAQVALAKFVNNQGLMHDGGSLFSASANSGDPIIGTAGTGGRGTIQPSSLEMSNVDLSRSLTELIIIQRGYEANSKTIKTSDQMLQTVLGLKQ